LASYSRELSTVGLSEHDRLLFVHVTEVTERFQKQGVQFSGAKSRNKFMKCPSLLTCVRRCFEYMLHLRTARGSLRTDSAKTPVHILIASRLDYYSTVLCTRST